MSKDIGITPGDRFGRLKVLGRVEDKVFSDGKHKSQYLCECSCSDHTQIKVTGVNLKSGNVKSCGCLKRENTRQVGLSNKTYGISTSKIAQAYYNMLNRCSGYICPAWQIPRVGIKNFYDDMAPTYIDGARLSRIDPSNNFSPENCYWMISEAVALKTGFSNAITYC